MRHKKIIIVFGVLITVAVLVFVLSKSKSNKKDNAVIKEINPVIGSIQNIISTTGTVLPKNRLEVKPPVNGRIDEILVKEGETVKAGQTLGWMSSTERAALLDAARGQGDESLNYWKNVYKAIPLISPIDGEVIVATAQPGQGITTGDPVIVLSDHLIVRAQVDETDIGKIKLKQEAFIALDAYPDANIKSSVEHIYYESETINNVTIYLVDMLPENTPSFFRSGMNATVNFVLNKKENILIVPVEAVVKDKEESYCLVKQINSKEPLRVRVNIGISDDKNIEVISGVSEKDSIVISGKKYSLPKNENGSNPFMPARKR